MSNIFESDIFYILKNTLATCRMSRKYFFLSNKNTYTVVRTVDNSLKHVYKKNKVVNSI